jgi:hypothetical protein
MDIFKLLNQSNCRECYEATCLAFAAAVFKGQKQLHECPYLDKSVIERYGAKTGGHRGMEQDLDKAMDLLKRKVSTIDLSSSAKRLGARVSGDRFTINVLGKDFHVDSQGNLSSEIHVHPWVTIPILGYILNCTENPVSGKWVPFRELKKGKTWSRLFEQRCEKPLKRIADTYTDLFEDLIRIFNGKPLENQYNSDISLVLYPLPKVPILICYWKPEDDLDSSLSLFFDSTAEDNLNIESLYTLGTGLVRMFEKLASRHGSQ